MRGVFTSLSYPLYVVVDYLSPTDDLSSRNVLNMDSLLDESIEQQTTGSSGTAVEPECVLIKVVVKIFLTDRSLMGTKQPALENCSDPVYSRHQDMGRIARR